MKFCCAKGKTEQEASKKASGKKISTFLPIMITFLATQHWLHGLVFIMLGGTASELMSMGPEAMLPFQRVMIVLTLATVLWSVYQLIKDGFRQKVSIVMTSISSIIGIGYVIVTLVKSGW
ncbi:hypothetical protein AN963_21240 [Brevibacillus choshinensis]|uniref:Uncharacterized protein n=1 Tax=Brevibacillus choshinensis TaxID=54911 RepID=A0ABR5N0E4_BRECH|nr:hypothetical protein [Brevibacillus choshinensis]KQL43975.1 hypothetical protein AN963_21240 [Brevibacillus choshinensis]